MAVADKKCQTSDERRKEGSALEEKAECRPLDGLAEVCVVEDDVGPMYSCERLSRSRRLFDARLATEFEGDLLQVGLSSCLHDGSADEGGAGECNLLNLHVCKIMVSATFKSFGARNSRDEMAAPATAPKPEMMLTTPAGKMPAMSSQTFWAESGVCSAVFKTMQLPVASAGPSFHASMRMGKFHGMLKAKNESARVNFVGSKIAYIWPITPMGSWRV